MQDLPAADQADPFRPLTLPNGAVLKNRIAKAAMEEHLAEADHLPGPPLWRLYERWAAGGAGLLLTGNIMVDARAMTGPGGSVLEDARGLDRFARMARAATDRGAHIWMQINHPGRQVYAAMVDEAVAPSAVAVDIPGFSKLFRVPRALTGDEVRALVDRFVRTATLAEQAGFTGVQIHAAHGYLLSQFLSPLTNRRADEWGGTIENRARVLTDIVRGVRAAVKPGFCVSVKLNSADFQRGGFDEADARRVVGLLDGLGVDLLEISGGTYESPAMAGRPKDSPNEPSADGGSESTTAREAYFLDFARSLRGVATMPVMLTGGFRRLSTVREALAEGIDVCGVARSLALDPDLPAKWRAGDAAAAELPPVTLKSKPLAALAGMALIRTQLRRMAMGKAPDPAVHPVLNLALDQIRIQLRSRRYRAWLKRRQAATTG